jgi:GR25 family glycosyltransferase involved in LPS biosynthesis
MKRIFNYITICLITFINTPLISSVLDYTKPALGKTDKLLNPLRNIDLIYIINLDQRPEKFNYCLQELRQYGIEPYRFSAVNGWELPYSTIDQLGVKFKPYMNSGVKGTYFINNQEIDPVHEIIHRENQTYFSHYFTKGAIGICLSHLSVLKDAYESGYNIIWVMEDDIMIYQDPSIISNYIDELNLLVGSENWDILFTDPDTKNQDGKYVPCRAYADRLNFNPSDSQRFLFERRINKNFKKIGARYGAYSMIINRSFMKKMLDFMNTYGIFLPYDFEYTLPNDIQLYSLTFDLVSTLPKAHSDNGSPNYKKKQNPEGQ